MKTYKGKSLALGGGGRFAKLKAKVKSAALAAWIGRKKYGKARFQSMARKGRIKAHFKEDPNGKYLLLKHKLKLNKINRIKI